MTIEELELSVRSFNCLKRAGINTVDDLINKSPEDMMKVRNLGKKSFVRSRLSFSLSDSTSHPLKKTTDNGGQSADNYIPTERRMEICREQESWADPATTERQGSEAWVTFLLENGKIETTVTRAKEVRAEAEKMITLGKVNTLHTKRQVLAYVTKEDVAKKVFDEIAPKYADKNGGYTRIYKIGPRRGDAAEMAIIELV